MPATALEVFLFLFPLVVVTGVLALNFSSRRLEVDNKPFVPDVDWISCSAPPTKEKGTPWAEQHRHNVSISTTSPVG